MFVQPTDTHMEKMGDQEWIKKKKRNDEWVFILSMSWAKKDWGQINKNWDKN